MDPRQVDRIDIFARWTGFGPETMSAAKLTLRPEDDERFQCVDAMTGEVTHIAADAVKAVTEEMSHETLQLDPLVFGFPKTVIDSHFNSCWTNDSPFVLIKIKFDDGAQIRCRSNSQHAFMLPLHLLDRGSTKGCETFNPRLSRAIAGLMPDGFILKTRLLDGDAAFQETQRSLQRFEELERQEATDDPDQPSDELSEKFVTDLCARPSETDEHGQTPLMYAAFPPLDRELFRSLVSAGANVHAARNDGLTGLHLASSGGMDDAAEEWIRAGADFNARTPEDATPLMLAALWPKVVRRLLDAGADVNSVDADGHSAIVYLIKGQRSLRVREQLESLQMLKQAGIDLHRNAKDGLTPIDHAEQAVRRRQIEKEVNNELFRSHHGTDAPSRSSQLERMQSLEKDETWREMFDTDYDDLQVAEIIHDLVSK